jgi:hypothetical protein
MYLENPPNDQTERWSGRPFRSLSVVHPPSTINMDTTLTQRSKTRFLEHLWNAQARFRARSGQSVVLRSEMMEVEAKRGKTVCAKAYYNVYQRTAFLQEVKKVSCNLTNALIRYLLCHRRKLLYISTQLVLQTGYPLGSTALHLLLFVYSLWMAVLRATMSCPVMIQRPGKRR